jgi:hypothetical protein
VEESEEEEQEESQKERTNPEVEKKFSWSFLNNLIPSLISLSLTTTEWNCFSQLPPHCHLYDDVEIIG